MEAGGYKPVATPRYWFSNWSSDLEKSRKLFVTSDHHFCHANIIQYCNRPFEDVGEMDEILVDNWNSIVSDEDVVFHLGDFCLGDKKEAALLLRKLNGCIMMLDNPWHHDKWISRPFGSLTEFSMMQTLGKLKMLGPMHTLQYDDMYVHMSHYPLASWDRKNYGSVMLHGHSHSTKPWSPVSGLAMDVGVDMAFYTPVPMDFVYKEWKEKRHLDNGEWEWSSPGWDEPRKSLLWFR